MANHKMVVLDGKFVRQEATQAVRTFFRPVLGAYKLVRDVSNPDEPAAKAADRKARS
jgi:hypothetical protein